MKLDKTSPAVYPQKSIPKSPPAKSAEAKESAPQEGVKDKLDIGRGKESLGVKDGVKKVWRGFKNWISDNITGHYPTPEGKKSMARIFSDYGPDHKNFAMAGAAVGGATGTALGLIQGYQEVKEDNVSLAWRTRNIGDPKLEGYSHWAQEVGHTERDYAGTDSNGNSSCNERYVVDGYWHRFSPDIRYDKVGTYQTPEYHHTNKWTPITAGLAGLAGGVLIGGIVGFSISMANKLVRNRINIKKPKK